MRQLFLLDDGVCHQSFLQSSEIQHILSEAVRFPGLSSFLNLDLPFDSDTCVLVAIDPHQIERSCYQQLARLPPWVTFLAFSEEAVTRLPLTHFVQPVCAGEDAAALVEEAFKQSKRLRRLHRRKMELTSAIRSLTPREQEVVRFVSSGMSTREVADELGIEVATVDKHRRNAFTKLQVSNVVELVNGLVDVNRLFSTSPESIATENQKLI